MTFIPFLCERCGYTSFDGEPHKCNPKIQKSSFYSRRFSICKNCKFNINETCISDNGKFIRNKITDFYDSCPNNFWIPVIFNCNYCNKLIVNTNNLLLKCPYCNYDLTKKTNPITEYYKKEIKVKNFYEEFPIPGINKFNINDSSGILNRPADSILIKLIEKIPKKELIIAHYNENLDWLNHIPDTIDKITIYNKGNLTNKILPNDNRINIIKLENIGREADTWLYHFISRRDTLADLTFLSQGNPFEHSPSFLDLLEEDYNNISSLSKFYTLKHSSIQMNKLFNKSFNEMNIIYNNNTTLGILEYTQKSFKATSVKGWKKIFISEMPKLDEFFFIYGGMCVLPKDLILFRDDSFYRFLIQSNVTAFQLEAAWYYIFNKNFDTIK